MLIFCIAVYLTKASSKGETPGTVTRVWIGERRTLMILDFHVLRISVIPSSSVWYTFEELLIGSVTGACNSLFSYFSRPTCTPKYTHLSQYHSPGILCGA